LSERTNNAQPASGGRGSAAMVAAGILLSRITGLISFRVFAHYFGNSDAADCFRAGFRIPNFLQNLFGEGVLSASFIPVYARLRAEGRHEEASRLAEAIFAILFLATALLVAIGVTITPWLIDLIAPGFHGEKRQLTITLVRIFFPGAGFLVFSAWCLGILNSHRKFFLPYVTPVLSNLAMIAAFFWRGGAVPAEALVKIVAWGSVVGSVLQFGVQLPVVLRFLWPVTVRLNAGEHVRAVARNFAPVFVARGVVQISGYIDAWLASFLGTGAVAAISYAQTLYLLPVSLFGMSVSAAELPEMSSALGTAEEIGLALRTRMARALSQIAFFVVPSGVAFLALGDVIVATIYKTGVFGARDVTYVWAVLAGSTVGLLAQTSGRLFSSAFYALRDTRTPRNFALIRVALTFGLGYLAALPLPRMLGVDPRWGVVGLTLTAGIAGWVEFSLLRWSLQKRIGRVEYPLDRLARLWLAALLAAAAGFALKMALHPHVHSSVLTGVLVLGVYGTLYLALTRLLGVGEHLDGVLRRIGIRA